MTADARRDLDFIMAQLSPEQKRQLAGMSDEDALWLHHSLGTRVRNEIRAGRLAALFTWSRAPAPARYTHLDDIAFPIMPAIIRAAKAAKPDERAAPPC